jgi:hypothetical protein
MTAISKYSGLCETCDHDATCTLRRSPRLEIILCEQFSTQPATNGQTHVKEEPSHTNAPGNGVSAACGTSGIPLTELSQISPHSLSISDPQHRKLS